MICASLPRAPRVHFACRWCKAQILVAKEARQKASPNGPIHDYCIHRERKSTDIHAAALAGNATSSSPSDLQPIDTRRRLDSNHESLVDGISIHQREMFNSNGFIRIDGTEQSRAIAWEMMSQRPRAGGELIAGRVRQQDIAANSGLKKAFTALETLLRGYARALGVLHDDKPLYLVEPKILVAPPGKGHQAVHWDGPRNREAAEKLSCILFCSNGHNGTAMPTFPTDERFSFSDVREELWQVAHLLDPEYYESKPVQPGDIIIFRQSTPHFGVENTSAKDDRVVLFCMLSPSAAEGQDAVQTFPWGFIGQAFGWESYPFAKSLVENREFKPLERMEAGDKAAARQCLQKHAGLWAAYNITSSK